MKQVIFQTRDLVLEFQEIELDNIIVSGLYHDKPFSGVISRTAFEKFDYNNTFSSKELDDLFEDIKKSIDIYYLDAEDEDEPLSDYVLEIFGGEIVQ